MSEWEFIVVLIATVGGLAITGFFFYGIFSIIKAWINRNNNSSEIDPQFFKALGEFKRSTERRISNLEAIISEMDEEKIRADKEQATGEITIESDEERDTTDDESNDRNLRNMLNE